MNKPRAARGGVEKRLRGPVSSALLAGLALIHAEAMGETPTFNYMLHCQGCHLADGGETRGTIPPLVGAGRFLSVAGGRDFLVQVPGVSLAAIDDAELTELLNWLLYRFSADDLPAGFEPYTAEEVARLRASPLVEVERVRAELVAALERAGGG